MTETNNTCRLRAALTASCFLRFVMNRPVMKRPATGPPIRTGLTDMPSMPWRRPPPARGFPWRQFFIPLLLVVTVTLFARRFPKNSDIPCHCFASVPRNQSAPVGASVINSDKTRWLFHGWDVNFTQGPPEEVVDLVMASHPAKGQTTWQAVKLSSICHLPAWTVVTYAWGLHQVSNQLWLWQLQYPGVGRRRRSEVREANRCCVVWKQLKALPGGSYHCSCSKQGSCLPWWLERLRLPAWQMLGIQVAPWSAE